MPSKLASIPSSNFCCHGVIHAPLELHHNGIKSHQTMVSHGLVRFFPILVFPSFFPSCSHLLLLLFCFFSFTFTVHCLLHCVSLLIPCNYETTKVFYTLFVDFLVCYSSHQLQAFLYISAPFYCFHCISCHFYSVSLFFLFNFHRSSCVLCLVHAFFYMFLQFSTVYNHFLHFLE